MSLKKRKICLVTGTRAEYGLSYPILRAIEEHPELELQLVVTGMHLLPEYGSTIDLIKKDGFNIMTSIPIHEEDSTTGKDMANSIAKCIEGLTDFFSLNKPDIVIAMTDLGFTLASAIAAAHMNIPVAHVHGGDVSGSIDDVVRHATTKLSHIHFPISKKSADRIIKMGEEQWRVHIVGAPGLDVALNEQLYDLDTIAKNIDINFDLSKPYTIFVQHPVTTEVDQAAEQYKESIKALAGLDLPTILIYPNADAGSNDIIKVIEKNKSLPFLNIFKSLPRKLYLSLLKHSAVMVGNSSSALLEAPSFHIPVVNIGSRQKNREHAENVIHVEHNAEQILAAVKKTLKDKNFLLQVANCRNPYGNGTAGKQICDILASIEIDNKLINKNITY